MRIQSFPISGEEPARLELRWDGAKAGVYLDGVHQATLEGASDLKSGWSTTLLDGSTLEVRAIYRVGLPELSVLLNGEHVPSSPSHPAKILSTCSNVMIGLSVFLIIAGALGIWGRAWLSVVMGVFYLVGGLLLRKRLTAAIGFLVVPVMIGLVELILTLFTGGFSTRWLTVLALNLLFITFIIRSAAAMRDVRSLRPEPAGGITQR